MKSGKERKPRVTKAALEARINELETAHAMVIDDYEAKLRAAKDALDVERIAANSAKKRLEASEADARKEANYLRGLIRDLELRCAEQSGYLNAKAEMVEPTMVTVPIEYTRPKPHVKVVNSTDRYYDGGGWSNEPVKRRWFEV